MNGVAPTLVPFAHRFQPDALALWRALHPEWTWYDDPEVAKMAFEVDEYRAGFAALRGETLIGTVFGTVTKADTGWPRNRYIQIEARYEDLDAAWILPALEAFATADAAHPETWHVASPAEKEWPRLSPLLARAGFTLHTRSMAMEWEGDTVEVVDASPIRFERYAGGNAEIDVAIVELHNRAYRAARLTGPANIEYLWKPWPGVTVREYVLARDGDRIVGYAELFVYEGKPCINSFVAARSHWGTPVGAAVGTKAMAILVGLGHRKLFSSVNASNAASMKLHMKHGWRIVTEQSRSYVRRFDGR
jgi:hypothetical protein